VMKDQLFMAHLLILGMGFLGVLSSWAAYRNGVNDGYKYTKEPWNPGYKKAGEYLKTLYKDI